MKMKTRRGLSMFVALLLVMSLLCGMTAAAETTDRGVRMYRGTFRYTGNKDTFYYYDSFFSLPGDAENEHLRTVSAAMAFSVLGTDPKDTVELMTDIGMEPDSIVMEDMVWGAPDTIGTVIAKKELGDMPLIAVAVRGSDYAAEWANNVTVGAEGDAEGFAASSEKVCDRIKAYLEANAVEEAKIWVCGYSRAGGVANLVGKAMNEDPAAFRTDKSNIYVYTYEAPRCSADSTVYPNIRNVYDVNDLVPHFYPEGWGLYLNGVAEKLGDPSDTMMAMYFSLAEDDYTKDIEERSKSDFLWQFEELLSSAVSRETYAASYQPYLSDLCDVCLSKSWDERQELIEYLKKVGELIKEYPKLGLIVWNLLDDPDTELCINQVSTMLSECMDAAREPGDTLFTDEEYARVKEAVRPLVTFMLTLADADLRHEETDERGKTKVYFLYHLVTLFANFEEFIQPHLNVNVFEKLKEKDSYYTAGVRISPGDVTIGEKRYTFNNNGWPLEDIVREAGFTEDDIAVWRCGYDIRLDTELTEITDPDIELYLKASGVLDKSMVMYSFYKATMTKTIGFRTYPVDPAVKLKDNLVSITIPKEIADRTPRLKMVRVDDYGSNVIDRFVQTDEAGDTRLVFNCMIPAVYASAYDGYRTTAALGEVDRDGSISAVDVTHIQRYLAEMEFFSGYQLRTGDIDGDGEVTTVDATWLQRGLAELDVPFVIGEDIKLAD